jgi:prepilin peptidase CpaA
MPFISGIVLIVTMVLLGYTALVDLKHQIIPNRLVALLAMLFFVHAGLAAQWTDVLEHAGFALAIFLFLVLFYARGWIGGGDVKLLTVAFLWTGVLDALVFSLLLSVCAGLHALTVKSTRLAVGRADGGDGRTRIPFAPSIAVALIGVLMLRYLTR